MKQKIINLTAQIALGGLITGLFIFMIWRMTPGEMAYIDLPAADTDYSEGVLESEPEQVVYIEETEPEPAEIAEDVPEVIEALPDTEPSTRSLDLGSEDTEILLKIAMAEAEGESTETKALIMCVVLNRVWSEEFPNTISEVVFQTDPVIQFTPTKSGGRYYTTDPNEDCYTALDMVLNGWDQSEGALYFERTSEDPTWQSESLEKLFDSDHTTFYK